MFVESESSATSVSRTPSAYPPSRSALLAPHNISRMGLLSCLLAGKALTAEMGLTIYNQNFAVVRDTVPLDLKTGVNQVRFAGATAFLEPSSVLLRDPTGRHAFQVLEQNYRGDPVSQERLLEVNEGKTIQFEVTNPDGAQNRRERIEGRIIRSGYFDPRLGYGAYSGAMQPVIEIDGKLRFGLPGQPIFPALTDASILKPTLVWEIESPETARFDVELSYVSGEMRWEADYNLVLPETGDLLDLAGWVTIDNECGKSFDQARIQLMAGDVSKLQQWAPGRRRDSVIGWGGGGGNPQAPPVTEKAFDEYHLYTLERPTTLHDGEKKQVEFIHTTGVSSSRIYIYDGAATDPDQVWGSPELNTQPEYGVQSSKKVGVMRAFTNSAANHLGLPLPKGRVRVYRRGSDRHLEFTGENVIKHTPRDELVRLYTGNAFDLIGERKRTDFKINVSPSFIDPATGLPVAAPASNGPPTMDESFEITLRNHKTEAVEIAVVEHLYRWVNWEIKKSSVPFRKVDAQQIEFRAPLKPDEERTIDYSVHYSW